MLAPVECVNGVSRVYNGQPSRAPHNAIWSVIFGLTRRRETVLKPPNVWSNFLPGCAKHIVPRDINPETEIVHWFHEVLNMRALVGIVVLCANHYFIEYPLNKSTLQMDNQVVSIRPAQLEVAQPGFQPSVTSSPANVYLQEVQAQTHDERRMSFTWRSPSSHLVCSPLAHVVFRIKVKSSSRISRHEMIGAVCGVFDGQHAAAGKSIAASEKFRPILCFGEGNCVANALESQSISVNGAVWTELNGNLYNRSLERCFVPPAVQQRAYSTCGGCPNKYDDRPLSGHVNEFSGDIGYAAHGNAAQILNVAAAANGDDKYRGRARVEGMTCDSGLAQRMENFYDQIVTHTQMTATTDEVSIEIRFPVQGGCFNSLWGASGLSRSDPRLRMALGVANLNQGQITFNFKDLIKNIVRRLGRPTLVGAANAAGTGQAALGDAAGGYAKDIDITYDDSTVPKLYLTYIRLPAFRTYPERSVITVYRRDARKALNQAFPKTFAASLFDSAGEKKGLQCGVELSAQPSTLTLASPPTSALADKDKFTVQWTGLQFPQVPNQIFIVMQKSSEVYNLKNPANVTLLKKTLAAGAPGQVVKWEEGEGADRNGFDNVAHAAASLVLRAAAGGAADADGTIRYASEIAGRYIAQNQDSNAAIMQLEITVQSAVGSWAFKSDSYPYLQDRDMLWQKHTTNCCDEYMQAGRGKWQDRASCVLLSCSDFLLGLSTSPGTVFPIILDIKCRFANRSAVCSGLAYAGPQCVGKQTFDDIMVGDPVCVACFNQQILSITSSSAVLSSQAFSQSTTASALASQG